MYPLSDGKNHTSPQLIFPLLGNLSSRWFEKMSTQWKLRKKTKEFYAYCEVRNFKVQCKKNITILQAQVTNNQITLRLRVTTLRVELIPEATNREPNLLKVVVEPAYIAIGVIQAAETGIVCIGLRRTPPETVATNGEEWSIAVTETARKT